ncbi:MAG TPA: polysaccharide biosynthesis/export family protein [Rhodanobacteraceae bacterium]|jgi:polysaccharide export outer membrane protein|nr:polysaccharide biosynthesis/export family protein [Rhodanobacteraceae bacterium]
MHPTFLRGLLAALLMLLLAACATNQPVNIQPGSKGLPPPSASDTNADAKVFTYKVGAGDVLEITVFGVDDLNRTVRVNSDGDISLPLIGSVHAGGETIPQLQDIITARLQKGFLQNPQVSIFVKDFVSQQITLDGSVTKPGIYPLTGKTTLLQALAMAGGMTDLAAHKDVVVFRQIDGKRMGAVFDMDKIVHGQAVDPQVYAGDIVVVSKSGSKNALQNFIKAAPALGLFLLL